VTIQNFDPEGFELEIWAEPANLNYFLKTELTPAGEGTIVNKTSQVKSHSRRQYPGDILTINVDAHERTYMVDPGRKVGNALPGAPFILDDGTEKRQFTFTGNVVDLHAFLLSDVKSETKLYTTGARYVIPAAEGASA
jgi:hypothetical protein